MYPRNAASPPRIAIGAVVQISDGAVQSSGVSVVVRAEGGSETAGGGTVTYGGSSSVVYYAPTQAETNYTAFVVTAYKSGCIPVSQTIITTASSTAGQVDVGMFGGTAGTFSSGRPEVNASHWGGTAVASANVLIDGAITAAKIASDAITDAKVASDVTIASVTGAVGSVTGNVGGNVVGSVASVTGAVGSVTGNVGGDVVGSVASVTGAVGSVTGNVGGNVVGSVASVTGAVGSVTGSVGGNVTGSVGSVLGGINTSGGTITTLDALDTAQDSQHTTTQGKVDTAQADLDLLTGADGAVLATLQPNYAPATAAALASLVTTVGVAGVGLTEAGGTGDHLTALATQASVDGLNDLSAAQVNAEIVDALSTDTYAEPASVPAATSSLKDKISWLFTLGRNKLTQTATTGIVRNDADNASIATNTVSDDGTTFTRGEWQ